MGSNWLTSALTAFKTWVAGNSGDPDVALAQYQFIQRQTPFLYMMSLAGGWGLSVTHWSVAPIALTLVVPLLVTAFAVQRIVTVRRRQKETPSHTEILAWQKQAKVLAVVSPAIFSIWVLSLFPYGGPYLQVQVVFTIAVANLVLLFCLIHFRAVALINAFCANTLYFIYFAIAGEHVFTYFALYGIAASMGAFFILNNHYRGFIKLIRTGRDLKRHSEELEHKQDETQKLSDLNYYIANHDHMTGLPNRRCFLLELDQSFRSARQSGEPLSLCVFDLGGLRAINNIYGLNTGDQILLEVVRRLKSKLAPQMFVARIAGDEFALLAVGDEAAFSDVSSFFDELFAESCQLPEASMKLNYAAGIAHLDESVLSPTDLLEHAVYVLQEAKLNRNEPVAVFGPRHSEQMLSHARVTQALQSADIEAELSVAFQPIVDVAHNRITGVECLARWNSPLLGNVPPGEFIPIAERCGVINRLTLVLLRKALEAARHWPADLKLSFNLSASNLSSRGFVQEILDLLESFGFEPGRLHCEVTETSVMWDFKEASRAILALKETGIRLSLDDFGTGYSSLSHVHKLPLDCIKVDRSFVHGIRPETAGYGIVKSLLALSRDMGIACVVEGVETEEELSVLKSLGTSEVQGYLFSRPLSEADLGRLFATGMTLSSGTMQSDDPPVALEAAQAG